MASYKDEQNALKAPDEFQKLGQEALPFFEKHSKTIMLGVGGVLVIGLLIGISTTVSRKGDETSAREFGAALSVLDREVNANPTGTAKAGEEPFKSETEKDEAIVKALTDFRASHGGSKAAVSAALPLAQAKLRQGKPDEALPLIEEFLAKSDANDALRPAGLEARGYALEAQKKYDDAYAAFEKLATESKDFMKGMGTYHQARVLQLKGDTAGAAKLFAKIDGDAPNTAASRLAKERIALLTAQGVDVPKPVPAALDAGM